MEKEDQRLAGSSSKRRRTNMPSDDAAPFPYAEEGLLNEAATRRAPVQWRCVEPAQDHLPARRHGHTLTLVGRRLFMLGGKVPYRPGALDVQIFDLDTRVWSSHTADHEAVAGGDAPTHRWGHSACLMGSSDLVIFGGFDHECNMASWKMIIFGGACCVGGPYRYYQDVVMLDWDEMKWTTCKCVGDKPSGRSQHSARYDSTHVFGDVHLLRLVGRPLAWQRVQLTGLGPESLAQLAPRDFRIFSARRPLISVGSYSVVLGGFNERVRALYSESTSEDDKDYDDREYKVHILDMRLRRWVRVLGVGLGPCELMQGGAANGWEAMIFGGTEGVSSEENALCALDLSPFFLPTLSRRAPPSPLSALSADLRGLLEQETYKDVSFVLEEDKVIRAHRCILAARCPVLRAMLESGMAESGAEVIPIRDLPYAGFYALLQFIYTGTADITAHVAQDVFVVAHQYGMEDLKDQCEHELVSQLLSGAPLEVETGGGEEAGRGKEAATDDLVATSPDETSAGSPSLAALLIFLRLADLHSARKLAAICLGTRLGRLTDCWTPPDLLAANHLHYAPGLADNHLLAEAGGPLSPDLRLALERTIAHLQQQRA
ncbi:BTB/POZ domain containing protein [Acanthamoeba castellanii str. Neff]|uniref:BTB/POZ domain containing protein n=1 Tax=Acanthamoeba castellanii (strain ATCC 30010 / Neff) TaxID=1257118 RepID=L8HGA8_ACACF|nr:BTB/POZ domain containing protein [Acanthamoeba castellanii str. Neff]ELR23476.1 BTB/POZ domain containing protein [Acanthamoeba castellanii str. Neff]